MTSEEQEIRRLERERCEALAAGNVAALGALMADDLVHIHGDGHTDGRAEYLDGFATKYIFHDVQRGDLDVRIYGDCAIVIGLLDQVVEVRGIDKRNQIKALASQVWVRGDSGWKQNTCHMHFLSVA